jgi:hypothetical protein
VTESDRQRSLFILFQNKAGSTRSLNCLTYLFRSLKSPFASRRGPQLYHSDSSIQHIGSAANHGPEASTLPHGGRPQSIRPNKLHKMSRNRNGSQSSSLSFSKLWSRFWEFTPHQYRNTIAQRSDKRWPWNQPKRTSHKRPASRTDSRTSRDLHVETTTPTHSPNLWPRSSQSRSFIPTLS